MKNYADEEVVLMSRIIERLSQITGISIKALKGKCRDGKTSEARQIAYFLGWNLTGLTQTEIGEMLGGRIAATVSYGYKEISVKIKDRWEIRSIVRAIEREMRGADTAEKEGAYAR